jgi:IS4 transposase
VGSVFFFGTNYCPNSSKTIINKRKLKIVKENELLLNKHQHIRKDEIIDLKNEGSKEKFPKRLRRVAVWDDVNKQVIELITNQFNWSCNTIGELYKSRWQVEIFFRDIKQLLHIKSFIRNS